MFPASAMTVLLDSRPLAALPSLSTFTWSTATHNMLYDRAYSYRGSCAGPLVSDADLWPLTMNAVPIKRFER